jgi:hypothetical protein
VFGSVTVFGAEIEMLNVPLPPEPVVGVGGRVHETLTAFEYASIPLMKATA